ncbi:hypothetical protein EVAR_54595_1 [Eumeta japonica]|uniref:Uncharacterized protein n=1 Tax=Eumeta variegata TaxID=151549 RepID=A0A4C1YP18_EUMVA|nr:hypothetical protein EVAR_54595_1 [Eumeta japonica]
MQDVSISLSFIDIGVQIQSSHFSADLQWELSSRGSLKDRSQSDAHFCEKARIKDVCQVHRGWRYRLNTPQPNILLARCPP